MDEETIPPDSIQLPERYTPILMEEQRAEETAQHQTPVSRPKIRNPPVHLNSDSGRFRNLVNFVRKGRIVPRRPSGRVGNGRKPITFLRLGKLQKSGITSGIASGGIKTEKEIQTDPLAMRSVATQTEEDDPDKENQIPVASAQHLHPPEVPEVPEDDAFMFAEPFKRARVVSSSGSESEQSESKRMKKTENPSANAEEIPPAVKTVVLESDDEEDLVAPTPPNPHPPRLVFVCSGLPV